MAHHKSIIVETPERLKELINTLWFGTWEDLSFDMGHGRAYISQIFYSGKIARHAVVALAKSLGTTPEKLMTYIVEDKTEKTEKPQKQTKKEPESPDDVLNMLTLIYEMEKRQVEALQRLNGMFERVWCK